MGIKAKIAQFMIPKLVHLTYKTQDLPTHWKPSLQRWKELGWQVMFHTDATNDKLVQNEYPEYLNKYLSFKYPIEKVDMVRLCFLHKWGGVYCDLDLYPAYDFYDEIKDNECSLLCSPMDSKTFTNMFMAGKAGHPFWIEYLDAISVQPPFWALGKHLHVMTTTGPLKMHSIASKTFSSYVKLSSDWIKCTVCDLEGEEDCPGVCREGKLLVVKGQSWNGWDSKLYNWFYCNRIQLEVAVLLFFVAFLVWKQNKK